MVITLSRIDLSSSTSVLPTIKSSETPKTSAIFVAISTNGVASPRSYLPSTFECIPAFWASSLCDILCSLRMAVKRVPKLISHKTKALSIPLREEMSSGMLKKRIDGKNKSRYIYIAGKRRNRLC